MSEDTVNVEKSPDDVLQFWEDYAHRVRLAYKRTLAAQHAAAVNAALEEEAADIRADARLVRDGRRAARVAKEARKETHAALCR